MTGISDDYGWIHLHRKIQFNFLWTEPRTFSKAEAWIDMLMEARHSEKPAQILIGSHLIECGRGQCIKSLESWGNRWHWNKSKVRRFFGLLETANQIRLENVTKTTRITICNYGTYNGSRNNNETIVKRSCNDDETHLTPNKNVRREECKNEKKNNGRSTVVEQLFEYCWELFGKYGVKKKALEYWRKISETDQQAIADAIPDYMAVVANGRKQMQFEGWINPANRKWDVDWKKALCVELKPTDPPQAQSSRRTTC